MTTSRSYSGVLIQLGDPSPGEVRRVDPNTSLPLVIPHDCRSLKVGNPDPEETVVGMLTACEQQWQITNYTRNATFVVENLEGGGEFIKIVPLWRQVTIPFELSRLVVPLRSGPATLRVFSPPPPTVLVTTSWRRARNVHPPKRRCAKSRGGGSPPPGGARPGTVSPGSVVGSSGRSYQRG